MVGVTGSTLLAKQGPRWGGRRAQYSDALTCQPTHHASSHLIYIYTIDLSTRRRPRLPFTDVRPDGRRDASARVHPLPSSRELAAAFAIRLQERSTVLKMCF